MKWFWYFTLYSALGCLIEVVFARWRHCRPDRKCRLILPLCPVYGLGACAGLAVAPLSRGNPAALYLLGAAACTLAEYVMAAWYETGLGVSFWDYRHCAANLHGRICLPFSSVWGALFLLGYTFLHPAVARFVSGIPDPVTISAMTAVAADGAASAYLLRTTGDRAVLRWYDAFQEKNGAV